MGHSEQRVWGYFCGSEQSFRTLNSYQVWGDAGCGSPPLVRQVCSWVSACLNPLILSVNTFRASPIHTDRGRSGWASERLCGKSLSRPLNPPHTHTHGGGPGSSSPIDVKIFSNQIHVRFFCFFFLWVHLRVIVWNLLAEVLFTTASHY